MKIKYRPTQLIRILGLDRRSHDNLAWCAVTYGASRLFWIEGYLICAEVHDKSFEQEMETREFTITHLCYSSFPQYSRVLEVEKGTHIPVVKVDDLKMYREILNLIKKVDGKGKGARANDAMSTQNKIRSNQMCV